MKEDGDHFQLLGFTRYIDTMGLEERLEAGTPIEKSELELWVLYLAATDEVLDNIKRYWSEMNIPSEFWNAQQILA